jgi:thioredoxin-dependent adenylylsulfate APS reductase
VTAPVRKADNFIHPEVLEQIRSAALEPLSAPEILTWAIKSFHPRLALSASFGGPEGLVLLDMMQRIEPASRVFVLDTGRLPQATYDLIDRVRERYDKEVEVVFPQPDAVQDMVREHGVNLFYESVEKRQLCCNIRKVEPLRRKLAEFDAWVTGLRREQNVTRTEIPKAEIDRSNGGLVKVNPIADWTEEDVWRYVRENGVPTNRLHKVGYPSVGCDSCSRAIKEGEDPRAGRWWWENPETKECGIHVGEEEEGSGI